MHEQHLSGAHRSPLIVTTKPRLNDMQTGMTGMPATKGHQGTPLAAGRRRGCTRKTGDLQRPAAGEIAAYIVQVHGVARCAEKVAECRHTAQQPPAMGEQSRTRSSATQTFCLRVTSVRAVHQGSYSGSRLSLVKAHCCHTAALSTGGTLLVGARRKGWLAHPCSAPPS